MSIRIWWVDEIDPPNPEAVADQFQTYSLSDLMHAHYLQFDESPPWINEPYFYNHAKWKELDQKLPAKVGPEGYDYPHVYFHAKLMRVVVDPLIMDHITQEQFASMRPILKRIAESGREVYEA